MKGCTGVCIFEGIMNDEMYVDILDRTLFPFVRDVFPGVFFWFMHDNDPKHTSNHAQQYFGRVGIYWWTTPPESP